MLKASPKPRRLLVIPDNFINGFVTDFYEQLITAFQTVIPDLQVLPTSLFEPRQFQLDLVIIITVVHWHPDALHRLLQLSPRTKLYCWHDDLMWPSEFSRKVNYEIFRRADCILHASKSAYLDMWHKYADKSHWVPFFASPQYFRPYNPEPQRLCLLSGQVLDRIYPFRSFVKAAENPYVVTLPHPGYNEVAHIAVTREQYAARLADHFCSVTCGGSSYGACLYRITNERREFDQPVDNYLTELMGAERLAKFRNKGQMVLKFFEIPAVGSLLLAETNSTDLQDLGLISGVNYLAVDQGNVCNTIRDCCEHPEQYEHIRRAGWQWAQQHTREARINQLQQIIGESHVKMC